MYRIIIQHVGGKDLAPKEVLIRKWAKKALLDASDKPAEVTIRIVDKNEMTELNSTYRKKKGPTNVLSFPFDVPHEINTKIRILGDVVVCAEVVNQEAIEQNKVRDAHWAHMIVHGIFHLLGYDHVDDKDAERMEALEIKTLKELGYKNPYEYGENIKYYD